MTPSVPPVKPSAVDGSAGSDVAATPPTSDRRACHPPAQIVETCLQRIEPAGILGIPRTHHEPMQNEFTAVFQKVPEGYIAFVEELPGANTQGSTLDEARENLAEAIQLVLEANRMLSQEGLEGLDVIREPIRVRAA
jgi:predicted RNase H-like HicB family nuclease